jgi:putative photosynthetic complex assembly protein 2
MATYGLPILFTLGLWWLSTIVILYLDGLHRRTFVWSLAGATLLAACAMLGLATTSGDASSTGAYCAFTCGLCLWAWQIITFYMGFITGPRKTACGPDCKGFERFVEAVRACAHHEIAVALMAVAIFAIALNQPNQFGLWTFLVLWWMHASAKLNVFFGVPNLGEEFIPLHMRYLVSFMSRKPMNMFFPLSVTLSTVIAVMLIGRATADTAVPFEVAGYTMLATLMVLAILEHWLLVTPFDANALWKWGVKAAPDDGLSFVGGAGALERNVHPACLTTSRGGAGVLESWSANPPALCDQTVLRRLLDTIGAGGFGDVESVKGVVQTNASWIQFESDGNGARIAPLPQRQRLEPLVVALGRRLDHVRLQAAFDACATR